MDISYTGPLSRAWDRMKSTLFQPFHIETWFVLGFAEFLAHLLTHSNAVSWGNHWSGRGSHSDFAGGAAADRAREAVLRLFDHPLIIGLVAFGLVVVLVLALVFAWISARAEFVWLEGVARRRPAIVEPWSRFGRLGRSLFLWRAAFSFTYLVPLAMVGVPLAGMLGDYLRTGNVHVPSIALLVVAGSAAGLVVLMLTWVYWVTNAFVVPLMYRYDETTTQAWGRFRGLLARHPGSFLAFTIFYVVLLFAAGVLVLVGAVGTCCIGLALLIIPYIGNVLLLPITFTGRALGPEFMAQFGPEWRTFPEIAPDEDRGPGPQPVA